MVLSVAETQGEGCMPCHHRYQTMVMVGFSLKHLQHHKRAEVLFKKATLYAKSLIKAKVAKSTNIYDEGMSEIGKII